MDTNARIIWQYVAELFSGHRPLASSDGVSSAKFFLSFSRWVFFVIGVVGAGIVPWWTPYLLWVNDQSDMEVRLMFLGVMFVAALVVQGLSYRTVIASFSADIEFADEVTEGHYYPKGPMLSITGREWGLNVRNPGRRTLTECKASLIDIRLENPDSGTMRRWPKRELHWPGPGGRDISGLTGRRIDLFRQYKNRDRKSIVEIAYAEMEESDRVLSELSAHPCFTPSK